QVAAEPIGDQVLDTVAGPVEPLALTADLPTLELPLAQRTEMLLEPRQAIGPQRGGPIDVAQAARVRRLRAAEDHSPLHLVRPGRQPVPAAARALAQLFPVGQLDDRPLHDAVVIHPRPHGPACTGTGRDDTGGTA